MSKHSDIEALARKIRDEVDGEPVHAELATNQRIIARVTDGIYREPWAAFRELIANAYDADATSVVIETKAPLFDQVVVRDNGNGMSPEVVAHLVRSIGGSSKRTDHGRELHTTSGDDPEVSYKFRRPLIGKIGIGIFAVAQLTQHFQIVTKSRGDSIRTSATIKLKTHDERRSPDNDKEFVAGTVDIMSVSVNADELDAHGTSITLYNLRPEILNTLRSEDRWVLSTEVGPDNKKVAEEPLYHIGREANPKRNLSALPPLLPWSPQDTPMEKFEGLLDAAARLSDNRNKPQTLQHFDEYLRLVWKLSLALPLEYITRHPFDYEEGCGVEFLGFPEGKSLPGLDLKDGQTPREKLGLRSGERSSNDVFDVVIDGILLRRPIDLNTVLIRKSRLTKPVLMVGKVEKAYDEKVLTLAGGQLSFEAYMYWNSKIIPRDISGALVRVREASGSLFDENYLKYQVSEQNRLSQIIVEIFVTEGLDGAINIDRESFNYSHPHFIYIQKWLHRALRLFINRLKGIAQKDLERERELVQVATQQSYLSRAMSVWEERLGAESDAPLPVPVGHGSFDLTYSDQPFSRFSELPTEVGDVSLDWGPIGGASQLEPAKVSAVAVVLEAYGALRELRPTERAALIRDIIRVVTNG